MLNDSRNVIEQMAFTEVHFDENLDPGRVKPSWSTDGWHVEKVDFKKVDISRDWSLELPGGFRQLSSVMRRFARDSGRDALQAVYSDGLATFSIFIESDQGGGGSSVAKSKGPINAYVHRLGDTMVTVVGEVPPSTVRDVALSVKAREAR
jgi:sigma-E factor negative regulatory protein RseB